MTGIRARRLKSTTKSINYKRLFSDPYGSENNQFGQFPNADFEFSDEKKRKYPFSDQKILLENIRLKIAIVADPGRPRLVRESSPWWASERLKQGQRRSGQL